MIHLLSKEQTYNADKIAMNEFLVPSQILMENAAISTYNILKNYISRNTKICIFCGSGNNGGDGFAIARHLFANNYDVSIISLADLSKMSQETRLNYEIAKKLNINIIENVANDFSNIIENKFDCYIEALIGIGGSENLKDSISDLISTINAQSGLKFAIDIPAGLNANSGKSHKNTFKADHTITMFAPKIGMYINDGKKLCGKIHIANLGVPSSIANNLSKIRIIEHSDIREILKERHNESTKFDYGRVLIIAGSEKYQGAATLCANASVRSGAGLVELATTSFHSSLFPEVIQVKLNSNGDGSISDNNFEFLKKYIEKADSIAIGPGLGTNINTINLIKNILSEYKNKKIVLDADGLNSLDINKNYNKNLVLTPHIYEFAKLFNLDYNDIQNDTLNCANLYAQKLNCVIHLKHYPSITTDSEFSTLTINGNSGMSSGGTGDVLTGIIASLAAQGLNSYEAASLGAYLHSYLGDYYIKNHNKESLKASDLIENLKNCF